jgi:hypothetical protein
MKCPHFQARVYCILSACHDTLGGNKQIDALDLKKKTQSTIQGHLAGRYARVALQINI